MNAQALKVEVYDESLEETEERVLFIKDSKIFEGALFFKFHEWKLLKKVLVSELLYGENEVELVDKCIQFYGEHWKISKDTEKTMKHWAYMNGFIQTSIAEYGLAKTNEE